uniref:Pheromone binding protein 3 n=1 Tax=Cyrtotrachelus buqueti TaxID=1892066 RepID=A0A1L3KPS0_9CUCU|nr:pheromone binding protein 3 [Cyrtotrachelus buqueti]
MKNSLIGAFVLCTWLLDYVQLAPPPTFQLPSEEERNRIALKCIDEVMIEKNIIEEVLKTQVLPHDDQKYKKFLECSYRKQGFLSLDGSRMLYDNLFLFLSEFYEIEDLDALQHCKFIKSKDAGDLCFQNLSCILDALRTVETLNGEDENNVQ